MQPDTAGLQERILVVDDDADLLRTLRKLLERSGLEVSTASTGEDGVRTYHEVGPDVVLLDLVLPGISGLDVLDRLVPEGATVVLLTGQQEVSVAVDAMRRGAENFLTKPVEPSLLEAAVLGAIKTARLKKVNRELSARLAERDAGSWAGRSRTMKAFARHASLLAGSESTMLLTGESGTGKGWLAERIHELSPRSDGPFVQVNCAGLSATFLETELFGHEKGAFTDARQTKRGLFEVADGGTLFLDEIGELASELQPRLLNVLEETTFRRLGGTREIEVDVRLIAATNRSLEEAVASGRFRADLFHRLNVLALHLPPLREREEDDRVELIHRMLHDLSGGRPPRLGHRTLDLLLAYPWPGNVRELRNVLERALVLAGGDDEIRPGHLRKEVRGGADGEDDLQGAEGPSARSLAAMEREHIRRVLKSSRGNRSQAARILGISRSTLYAKMDQHGLR